MSTTRLRPSRGTILLAVAISTCLGLNGAASLRPAAAADASDPADQRQAALQWLDTYMRDAVLLKPDDVAKIRDTVAQMTPSQLSAWLEQTEELREFIESDSWQATREWLREFLRVQAIYSDEEIEQLRERVRRADPDELIEILKQIQQKHSTLSWMHQTSSRNRQATINRTEQQRQAAPAATATTGRSAGNRPLFGGGSGDRGGLATNRQKRGYKGYRTPRPLITSREVARESVRYSLFPRGGWYGW